MTSEAWAGVTLARILRPHGRAGEVAAEILTDFREHLLTLRQAYLWDGATAPQPVAVRSCWLSRSRGGQAILHFAGCDSIDDAKRLVGLQVQVPLAERVSLPTGRYYITDLVGCEVWERGAPAGLGKVRDVIIPGEQATGTPVLVLETAQGELLVPFATEICPVVDVASRRIEVILPEGLCNLNSP